MAEERSLQIATGVDTTGVTEGMSVVRREVVDMAAQVRRSGAQAAEAVGTIGNGADRASRNVEAAQRNLIGSIQRTSAAMESGARSSSQYFEALARQRGVDLSVLEPYLVQLRQLEGAQRNVGTSAAQTAAALRGVPAQITDIVTSIQGGQAPLTVFLQQCGQLRDTFGSFGGAARGISSTLVGMINPLTVAGAAAVVLAFAYHQGSQEADVYRKALVLSGNAAGTSAGQMADMARSISLSVGTQGAAAEALAALAGTGKVASTNLQQFADVAIRSQRSLGISVKDTAATFADLGRDPVKALERLNEQYNFLTPSVYAQVKALQEQGHTVEAAAIAQKTYAEEFGKRTKEVQDHLGTLERFWQAGTEKAKGWWDAVLDVGRTSTVKSDADDIAKQIAVKQARMEKLTLLGPGNDNKLAMASLQGEIALLRQREELLQSDLRMQAKAGDIQLNNNRIREAGLAFDKEGEKYQSRAEQLANAIAAARNKGAEAGRSEGEVEKRVADIRKSYADIFNDSIDSQIEAMKRRGAVEEVMAKRSIDLVSFKRSAGILTEEQYITEMAALDLKGFDQSRKLLEAELGLAAKKQNSKKEQAGLLGQIDVLDAQRASRKIAEENDLFALEQRRTRTAADNYASVIDRAMAERDSLVKQTQAQKDANEQIGLTKKQLGDLAAERLIELAIRKEADAEIAEGIDMSGRLAESYREQAAALRERAKAMQLGADRQVFADMVNPQKAADELRNFLDPSKARDFGSALKEAFGGAGDAISKLTGSLETFGQRQAELSKMKGNAALAYLNGLSTEKEYAQQILALNRQNTKSQLAGYGDMTSAAAGFFGEQSTGYRALSAASQVFHAAELAMTLSELVPKAISAVLNQGTGDPYTAFGRMAAMAAIVAGLGVAVGGSMSGGSGGQSAADAQKVQGTKTTFGNVDAKSDSISKALGLIEKNTYQGLDYSAGMLEALRNIESSMSGLNNLIVRADGVTSGANLGIATGTNPAGGLAVSTSRFFGGFGPMGDAMGSLASAILGKTTKSIVDSGIQFGGRLSDLQDGVGYNQYASVDTTTKRLFGIVKKKSNSVTTQALDDELATQFGLIFSGLEDTLKGAAVGLGLSANDVSKSLDGLVLATTTLSLKDLKGDELTAALNAVISKSMDQISEAAFPSFEKFRKVGEGYAETVVRIASDFAAVDTVFASFGKTFGMLGLESIGAREHLIALAGGLEDFSSQGEYFLKNFFTEKEQAAALKERIDPTLKSFGLSTEGEAATKLFRDFVVALDTTTDAGAAAYSALMKVAPAFSEVVKSASAIFDQRRDLQDQLDELTMSPAQLLAKQRAKVDPTNSGLFDQVQTATAAKTAADALAAANKSYQDQIDSLFRSQLTGSALRAAETKGMDASTIALYDLLAARKQEIEASKLAADAAIAAAKARADVFQSFGDAFTKTMTEATAAAKALRDFNDSLLLGNLSALDPEEKYREAKRQFMASDGTDTNVVSAFLQAAKERDVDAFFYQRDFAAAQAKLVAGAQAKDDQAAMIPAAWKATQAALERIFDPTLRAVAPAMQAALEPAQAIYQGTASASTDTSSMEAAIEAMSKKLEKALGVVADNTAQTSDLLDRVTAGGNAMVTEAA